MAILAVRRPRVKPTRRSPCSELPFGAGLLPDVPLSLAEVVRATPIDRRDLPTVEGAGLTAEESRRVNGARNRARAEYARSCPDASLAECDVVARKAAVDELRRTLRDRPAAPPLKPRAVEVVTPPPTRTRATASAPAVDLESSPLRHTGPSVSDRQWWAEHSPTRNELYNVVGRCPVVAPEPEPSDFDAWLEDGCPEPEPELTAAGTWA